ncbi:replication initiation protein [Phage C75C1]|jgi:hypothetical protein|nr:replication initiation protein [Phage C75C1]
MDYITIETKYAKQYGLHQAIVLHTLIYFVLKNKKEGRNKHEGKHWTFNSYTNWQEAFPFFTKCQIRKALRSLREQGAVIVGNFNKMGYDKTYWYTIDPILLQEAESTEYWRKRLEALKHSRDKKVPPIPNNEYIYIEPY